MGFRRNQPSRPRISDSILQNGQETQGLCGSCSVCGPSFLQPSKVTHRHKQWGFPNFAFSPDALPLSRPFCSIWLNQKPCPHQAPFGIPPPSQGVFQSPGQMEPPLSPRPPQLRSVSLVHRHGAPISHLSPLLMNSECKAQIFLVSRSSVSVSAVGPN